MQSYIPLFPPEASTMAPHTDALLWFLLGVSAFFSILIAVLLITFAFKYRRRSEAETPPPFATTEGHPQREGSMILEVVWIGIPLILVVIMFVWGASLFIHLRHPPADAEEIFVVGKQWMWKLQHLEGVREINELHVPVGKPIKLTMTSEDVIHSFFVPAFRVKQDVLPGRYTSLWFQATKPGRYHLFCSQYCGTDHARMIGWVIVMDPAEYQTWLSGGATGSLASAGEKLFQQLGCVTCHRADGAGRGPVLQSLFGKTVHLQGGGSVVADEGYIHESIINPQAKVVAGYQPIMPTFKGLVSEEGVLQLIAYVKSLGAPAGAEAVPVGDGRPRPLKPATQEVKPATQEAQ